MANCNPPVKNQAFDLGFTLYKSDGSVIANPGTLTAKISKDFGDYADIGTTSEEDTTYGQMKAALSATEMNADVVMLYIKDDTAGCVPFTATIYTCSATRGLAGTALPNAAADAAGGLPISDAGGLDLDTYIKRLEAAWTAALAARIDENISAAKTLTVAYDAAKAAAPAGAKMDLVDAPNATAVTAIQNGLATAAKLLAYVKSILRKDQAADADIAGTYDATTDSLQAIRDTEPMGTAMRGTDGANTTTPPSTADIKMAMEGAGSHLALIKAETDKLADTLEDDGGTYRFTENALEQAPSGTSTGATLEEIEGSTVLAKEATVEGVATDVDTVVAAVAALGAAVVTVTSPVSVDGETITLVCGDDYYNADGRALTWTDSGGTYASFTGGSCKLTVRDLNAGTDTETVGTVVDANTVRFELPKATTEKWTASGRYRFDVEVTLSNGHEVTMATGSVTMLAKYSG